MYYMERDKMCGSAGIIHYSVETFLKLHLIRAAKKQILMF